MNVLRKCTMNQTSWGKRPSPGNEHSVTKTILGGCLFFCLIALGAIGLQLAPNGVVWVANASNIIGGQVAEPSSATTLPLKANAQTVSPSIGGASPNLSEKD